MSDNDGFNHLRARIMAAQGFLNRMILETASSGRRRDIRFTNGRLPLVTEVGQCAGEAPTRDLGEAIGSGHSSAFLVADVRPRPSCQVRADLDMTETGQPPAVEHGLITILFDVDRCGEYLTLPV